MSPSLDVSAWQAIRALQQPGAPDLLSAVVHAYVQHVPQMLDEIRDAAGRTDWNSVTRCAHTLKSSSMQIGARRLAALCEALEDAARNGAIETLDELRARVENEFAVVHTRLRDELGAV